MEFTTVLMFEKYGVLKILLACSRNSSERDSRMVMVLLIAESNVNCEGPSIMLRPASPYTVPPAHAGCPVIQNAEVLNHSFVVGFGTLNDCPETTFARMLPLTPRLMSCVAPNTCGVKYSPEAMVKSPLHCQPPSTCEIAPLVRNRRPSPNGKS